LGHFTGRKVKYVYAFKIECVTLVLEKHYLKEAVSKLKGLDESNIGKWVSFYKAYGRAGLLSRKNQNYTVNFKLKVLKSMQEDHFHYVIVW